MTDLPDYGPLPELRWIPLNQLVIDHNYQRDLDSKHAQNILSDFMWQHFQVVTVTPLENDLYAVIDGQHRTMAARSHPMITEVPCAVLPAMSTEEQALGFARMNRVIKRISALALYWAELAGQVPEYVAIDALMKRVGVKVMPYSVTAVRLPKLSTTAISKIMNSVKKFGEPSIETALLALADAWPEEEGVFSYQMLNAVEHLVRVKKVSREVMAETLRTSMPHMFLADAKELSGTNRTRLSTALIEVISECLPKGRTKRTKKQDEEAD